MIARILPIVVSTFAHMGEYFLRILGPAVVKQVVIDELKRLSKRSDNKIDAAIVRLIEARLRNEEITPDELVINALEAAAASSNTTIDDKIVAVVKAGMQGVKNPAKLLK